jgi:hypothetical protein
MVSKPATQNINKVGQRGESFHEGIAQHHEKGHGAQIEAEGVQHPGGEDQQGSRQDHEYVGPEHRDRADRDVAVGGARVSGVDLPVGQAVEGHRRAAGAHHRHEDPHQDLPGGAAVRGDQERNQGERQGKDRVFEFDEAEVALDQGHRGSGVWGPGSD